jgi:hypothetical protein
VVLAVVQLHVDEQDFFLETIFVLEGSHVLGDFVDIGRTSSLHYYYLAFIVLTRTTSTLYSSKH